MKTVTAVLFAFAAAACTSGNSTSGSDSEGGKADASSAPCIDALEAALKSVATETNDTAKLIETRLIYGNKKTSGSAMLARFEDDDAPSDWIAVAVQEPQDVLEGEPVTPPAPVCKIAFIDMANTDTVADDLAQAVSKATLPDAACLTAIEDQVTAKAQKLDPSAFALGITLFYGSFTSGTAMDDTILSVMSVGVSGVAAEGDRARSDYMVVVDADCTMKSIELVGSGFRPEIVLH